jgi:hypothetical protein
MFSTMLALAVVCSVARMQTSQALPPDPRRRTPGPAMFRGGSVALADGEIRQDGPVRLSTRRREPLSVPSAFAGFRSRPR